MADVEVREVLADVVRVLGGQQREGQAAMSEAVADAFTSGRHLLVQAGTGTGKSLGYLVPALLHAHRTGGRVVVATSTLALQRQIVGRDLPALTAAARSVLDEVPEFAVLKGRANHACLHRVREGAPDDQDALFGTADSAPSGSLGAEVLELRSWAEDEAASGGTADRDDAPRHSDRAWRQVSVTARECLGATACPFARECFAENARDRALEAGIVITNHAMLAIHAINGVPMLPEHEAVVIDEAHDLTARVTQSATEQLDAGTLARIARRAAAVAPESEGDLMLAADALADAATRLAPGRIDVIDDALRDALAGVRDATRSTSTALPTAEADQANAGLLSVKAALDEVRATAERILTHRSGDVVWVGDTRQGLALHVAPVDVAAELRERLFDQTTCVLTSATLALGGSFTPLATSVGLDSADMGADMGADSRADTWDGLDVGSPFDYASQGILYVARHLGPPGRDGLGIDQLGEITALVRQAGGRTLGLFSSRRAAEQAAVYVRDALPDFTVLCQGDAHLTGLTERFVSEPATSLFGTLGLWQGLDLPGDTCTLVIIDRVPFPRPDDPVMSARARLVEQRGGNGFMQVSAQHAALLLAQGAGRLIRSQDDRGVVAILDPRIATARYGPFLAASLPPLWRTSDRDIVLAALGRLDSTALQVASGRS